LVPFGSKTKTRHTGIRLKRTLKTACLIRRGSRQLSSPLGQDGIGDVVRAAIYRAFQLQIGVDRVTALRSSRSDDGPDPGERLPIGSLTGEDEFVVLQEMTQPRIDVLSAADVDSASGLFVFGRANGSKSIPNSEKVFNILPAVRAKLSPQSEDVIR
jgi:hypothetical protein